MGPKIASKGINKCNYGTDTSIRNPWTALAQRDF